MVCLGNKLQKSGTQFENAGAAALRPPFTAQNLSKTTHFVGIQFIHGSWQGTKSAIVNYYVGTRCARG
jgi:hypothetical protein